MREINLTAAAWIPEGPRVHLEPRDDVEEFRWKVRAEVSVTDSQGKPLSALPKKAWSLHVTDYTGRTFAPGFTLTKANVSGQAIPGFYILAVDDLRLTGYFVAPTALGLGVELKAAHAQIVVPIELSGLSVIWRNEPIIGLA